MGRLSDMMDDEEVIRRQESKQKTIKAVKQGGRAIYREVGRRKKRFIIPAVIIGLILAFLYIPGLFMREKKLDKYTKATRNPAAVTEYEELLKNEPSADWDEDGLTNEEEQELGTDPLDPDTDGDGAYDSYEKKSLKTKPAKYDKNLLKKYVKKEDKKLGNSKDTPYKIGDVILWAKNYKAKANGSVVKTLTGYRFTGFKGYAQFPVNDYAYEVKDGRRILLDYKKNEKVWKIDGDMDVEVFDHKLEEIVALKGITGKYSYKRMNALNKFLLLLLPEEGFITATKLTEYDISPNTTADVRSYTDRLNVVNPSPERLKRNTVSLDDLNTVYNVVREEGRPVAVSLFNPKYGEYIGLITGITKNGNFIISEPLTGEFVGGMYITVKSRPVIDNNGEYRILEYFEFDGCGYSSEGGSRISFFAQQ